MSTENEHGGETVEWFVEPNYLGPHARSTIARLREDRANSIGVIISTCIFFALIAAAITFGGHAALRPFAADEAAQARDGRADVVLPMPDGVFCRHMSLDNETGQIREGSLQRCGGRAGASRLAPSRFSWGAGR